MASDFSDLLKEAEKLTANIEGTPDLPRIDRSLHQVLQASSELYSKVAQASTQDVEANLLLGSKGVDLRQIGQTLDNIIVTNSFEKIVPIEETDIDTLLDNKLKADIANLLQNSIKEAKARTHCMSWENQLVEWDKERMTILNSMGLSSEEFIDLGQYSSVLMVPPMITPYILSQIGVKYVGRVLEYNSNLLRGGRKPNLVDVFANAAVDFKDPKVDDMWQMVKYMTNFAPAPSSEDPIKARYSPQIVKQTVLQGLKYLQDRYKTYMTTIINENLFDAKRGGTPGTYSLVRSFVGIRFQGEYSGLLDGTIEDRPLWPMVYYCLRSGDLAAAILCLQKARHQFRNLLVLLETKLHDSNSSQISKLEAALNDEYMTDVFNSTDPFKRIVFESLSSTELDDEHSEVAKTADDYLWLQLSLLKFDNDRNDVDKYRNLQETILVDCGESHYDALKHPHLYFQMLILTGQFEAALEFLARIERHRVHGVHMAIAMSELHVLGLAKDPSAPLISEDPLDPKPARRLNLVRLIMIFTGRFEMQAIAEAIQYYFFLRDIYDGNKQRIFVKCVVDLVIQTQMFDLFFGEVEKNGIRTKGYLDEFSAIGITVEDVANITGKKLEELGQFEGAILLYDLADNQEEVLKLCCTLLAQVVHLKPDENNLRSRLPATIANVHEKYSGLGYKCSANLVSSFLKLKDLLIFFDQYHRKDFGYALKILRELKLVPSCLREVEECVNNFARHGSDICKIIPDLVLATMNILFDQYQKIKAHEYATAAFEFGIHPEKQLSFIREQAKALTNFVGMINYRMPGDTNSRLVQMEILMH